MPRPDAIAWTTEMEAQLGTASDATIGKALGLPEDRVRYRRRRLSVPTYRSTRAPVTVRCANCGTKIVRKARDQRKSSRLFCGKECASAGQKRRDSETLRYGPGWKNRRAEIRTRDKVCRGCGKTPEENGSALHVHHLVPFRYGGTNRPSNLVALCDSCHHTVEAMTDQALAGIRVEVKLVGSSLTVTVDGQRRLRGSVPGAGSLTAGGSPR